MLATRMVSPQTRRPRRTATSTSSYRQSLWSNSLCLPRRAPPSAKAETKDVRPRGAWETSKPKSRASVEKSWVRMMREAVRDVRD
jgi:hypothetical protein